MQDHYFQSHFDIVKFTCKKCGQIFNWQSSCSRHTKICKGTLLLVKTNGQQFVCVRCGQVFEEGNKYHSHIKRCRTRSLLVKKVGIKREPLDDMKREPPE